MLAAGVALTGERDRGEGSDVRCLQPQAIVKKQPQKSQAIADDVSTCVVGVRRLAAPSAVFTSNLSK